MDNNYDDIFQSAGAEHGVDPLWLKAQALAESSLDPTKVNPETGAAGISQFLPETAQKLGVDTKDPKSSINGQARLMAENVARYKNLEDATRAYHGGTDQANWGPKTEAYAQKVKATYQQLKQSSTMTDPAEDFWGTTAPAAPQKDDDVENFWAASPTMGPPKSAVGAPAPVAQNTSAAPISTEQPTEGPTLQQTLTEGVLGAYLGGQKYLEQGAGTRLGAFATGVADVPNSLARFVPYSVARPVANVLYGKGAAPEAEPATYQNNQLFDQAKVARNAQFAQQYGNTVGANFFRGAGNIAGSAPVFAGAGLIADAAATAAPEIAPAINFMSGQTSRFAPAGASVARSMGQYGLGLASKAASGVGAGELATALTNAASDKSYQDQRNANDLFGTGLGVGGAIAGDAAKGVGRLVTGEAPVTSDIPTKVVDAFKTGDIHPTTMQMQDPVPGVQRSLATATQDPGIAELQRQLGKTDPSLAQLYEQNNAARAAHIEEVAGVPADIEAAAAARDAQREADVANLWQAGQKADTSKVVKVIDDTLAGPSGERPAVKDTLNQIRSLLVKTNADKTQQLQTDPETLYESVRKGIGDLLDKKNLANPAGRQAQSQLLSVQSALDDAIEQAAPGFKQYMDNYAKASSDIDGMTYMQGLKLKNADGALSLPKINSALDKITQLRAKPGVNAAKNLTDKQVQALKNVQKSLLDESILSKSAPMGSATSQNLKATSKMNDILPGGEGSLAPEAKGAAIGGIVGGLVGHPVIGATIGDAMGRAGAAKAGMQRELELNKLGLVLADPTRYVTSTLNRGAMQPTKSILSQQMPNLTMMRNALVGPSPETAQ